MLKRFVPTTPDEMAARGWSELDILFITGDAYVDHPSYGVSLLGRLLLEEGYRVGIIGCPDCRSEESSKKDFLRLGTPRLFVGIGSGVVDSMINNYTANRKKRSDDAYAPGGKGGLRPDYAASVYSRLARKVFPSIPVIGGGVEVSLRRLAHYDYWQNRIKPSILLESAFDLLVYGMGEKQIRRIAAELKETRARSSHTSNSWWQPALERLSGERGLVYVTDRETAFAISEHKRLPSFEEVRDDKKKYARAAVLIEAECNPFNAKTLVQSHGSNAIVVTPPALPIESEELDRIYGLPFTREPHFIYKEKIPAADMIKFSVTVNRGCFGGCTFCALALHQGRIVQSRSPQSVLKELTGLLSVKGFTGIVSDLGGPTANMYGLGCGAPESMRQCRRPSCLQPGICKNLNRDHSALVALLKKSRAVAGIRKVLIGSGLRIDLALGQDEYLNELITHHVGGHLKVAPEHTDPEVLELMRKPTFEVFLEFQKIFERISEKAGKEQYIVPYFISGFPGTTAEKMEALHKWVSRCGWKLQQVQAFIPTPMTIASAIYWSGLDPYSRKPIHVPKNHGERMLQQALLQPHRGRNREIIQRKRRISRHSSRT